MNNRPPSTKRKTGLLPKLKGLFEALGDRYQRVLQVIDEALASDNLKDRIWAVDWILKRTPDPAPPEPSKSARQKARQETLSPESLAKMNDAELLARIRTYLDQLEA